MFHAASLALFGRVLWASLNSRKTRLFAGSRKPHSEKRHQEEINEGLEAGADDYITKPFDLQELKARLRVGKRILELQEQLVSQATHDSLTSLLNRSAILDVLQRELCLHGGHLGSYRKIAR